MPKFKKPHPKAEKITLLYFNGPGEYMVVEGWKTRVHPEAFNRYYGWYIDRANQKFPCEVCKHVINSKPGYTCENCWLKKKLYGK